jgi:hypothetical protein
MAGQSTIVIKEYYVEFIIQQVNPLINLLHPPHKAYMAPNSSAYVLYMNLK